jgi:hypothetical protein
VTTTKRINCFWYELRLAVYVTSHSSWVIAVSYARAGMTHQRSAAKLPDNIMSSDPTNRCSMYENIQIGGNARVILGNVSGPGRYLLV